MLLVAGATLTSCGGPAPPPPPPPTIVELTVTGTAAMNPDGDGRPSPVIVRVYQLAAGGSFGQADFFKLYDKEAAVLGPDLQGRDEIQLTPGATKTLTIEAKPQTTLLGFVAAYRDIGMAQWRAQAAVPAHKTTKITVTVDKLAVTAASGS